MMMLHRAVRSQTHLLRPTKTFYRCKTDYNVTLHNNILYIPKDLAEALGWRKDQGHHVTELSLCGIQPEFFAITPAGTRSELLARGTVESFMQRNMKTILEDLKESDQ
ncbi:hypothetical protein K435DRAFT_748041 [Dendrothele bispora CBS 962.96]|uniref:Uncharacterized protein n=1 Tax=Dendrothele bispora (strain CBS 962.96) TaxID=1314807 RepID=A0A4S8MKV9_DENBC|nr:hypothetical protein K435DRAFT_748041 [Dendrothele bispora CBS 962.96]